MPAYDSGSMDMKVIYNKGGKKNGYHGDDFDRPSDWENEYSDEDEVFVEGANMDESSATKPLMYPRSRTKTRLGHGSIRRCRSVLNAICCFLFLVLSLGSLMGLVVYYVNKHEKNKHSHSATSGPNTPDSKPSAFKFISEKTRPDFTGILGCDNIEIDDVWTLGIPKLLTESAFRLVDVNKDGVLDVIVGFATGGDGYNIPSIVCDIYFAGTYPCYGGLLALEGATGRELWRHYSDHEIYGINCEADLNKDGVHDCLAGGRAGAFEAISGRDGTQIWNFGSQEAKNDIMNLYTAQLIPDIDGDGTVDVLTVHGGDPLQDPGSAYRLSGRILLMSGSTGKVIRWLGVPDGKESYYSPQLYTWPDGTRLVLFGTGGETHGGSLWVVKLHDLIRGEIKQAQAIFTDKFKGIMTPPVLADVTGDGVEDIIIPVFNSSILAINGQTFKVIWNYTVPMSESYNTPSPGYYNDDDIPDFLIKFAHGPGFPVYFHSQTTVLDGRTGKPLIDPPVRDTVGAQASAITVSVEGRGNDIFLYWAADCEDHTGEGGEFHFVEGTNVHEQSRSDFCRLRFKSKGYSKVYAINSHIPVPGTTVYYSADRKAVEHANWVNTTALGLEFVRTHPEYQDEYEKFTILEQQADKAKEVGSDKLSPSEEGIEALYETPIMDQSERTTYKKGPPGGSHRSQPHGGDTGPAAPLPDYSYDPAYFGDPYKQQQYQSDVQSGRSRGRSRTNSGYNRGYDEYFSTTPPPRYSPSRHRQRYPSSDSTSRVRGRSPLQSRDSLNTNPVKPIAMRDLSSARKRVIHNRSKRDKHRNQRSKLDTPPHSNVHEQLYDLYNRRMRRHVGPHDEDGAQRLLSTGSLIPTLLPKDHPKHNNSIDFVFATYWFFPAKTRAILPADQHCIEDKLSKETIRFDTESKYYGMDHDAYEHTVTNECLQASGHDLPDGGIYESQTGYNPFNVHMGQMTVYRVRLTCTCSNMTSVTNAGKQCSRILPFDQQEWYGYMGNKADSHWRPRPSNN